MNLVQKSIIYFLGLYAPENIAGIIFAITDTPLDEKYDTNEIVDTYYRYRIPYLYTEEDIVSYLGEAMKQVNILITSHHIVSQYKDIKLMSLQTNNSSSIHAVSNEIILSLTLFNPEYTTTDYISITDIVKYHHHICNNKWYRNYYKKLGINPVKELLDKIYKKLGQYRSYSLYILNYILDKKTNIQDNISYYNNILSELLLEFDSLVENDIAI